MSRYLILLFKIGLSAALVWYVFSKIDTASAFDYLRSIPIYILAGAIILLLLQQFIAGLRLRELLSLLDVPCRIITAVDVVLIGVFFSQTFISFIGGDVMRIWRITRSNVPVGIAAKAILFDRVVGFVSLLLVIILTLPFALGIINDPHMRSSLYLLIGAGIAATVVFMTMDRLPESLHRWRLFRVAADISSIALDIARSRQSAVTVLGYSLAIQVLNVVILYVVSRGLDMEISFVSALVLIPPVLLIAMLPISVAGWGVREGAMIVALALVGVHSAQSLALSICFGLLLITLSLPGGVIWFLTRHQTTPEAASDSDSANQRA